MKLSSSSSSKQHFPLFSNGASKLHFTTFIKPSFSHSHVQFPSLHALDSSSSAPSFPAPLLREDGETAKRTLEELLVVRRPVKELTDDGDDGGGDDVEVEEEEEESSSATSSSSASSVVDAELARFAKKMPIFEPKRVDSSSTGEKPLGVNLDLALYRAKVLARSFKYKEAEELLQKEKFWVSNQKQTKQEQCMRRVAKQHKAKMPTFGSVGLS